MMKEITSERKFILLYSYEQDTVQQNPTLERILRRIPHLLTVKRAIEFFADAWDRDVIPFQEYLIKIEREWKEIAPHTPCPIHFTEEEIQQHHHISEGWNERANFWDRLDGFVSRDGWTSNESYDEARKLFADLRDAGLAILTDADREELETKSRWAT